MLLLSAQDHEAVVTSPLMCGNTWPLYVHTGLLSNISIKFTLSTRQLKISTYKYTYIWYCTLSPPEKERERGSSGAALLSIGFWGLVLSPGLWHPGFRRRFLGLHSGLGFIFWRLNSSSTSPFLILDVHVIVSLRLFVALFRFDSSWLGEQRGVAGPGWKRVREG